MRTKLTIFCALGLLLLGLTACTPADEQYCESYGVGGTPEYAKCLDYYHAQDFAFRTDRMVCEREADMTYPPSLYDYGHYEQVVGGWSRGVFYGGETVLVQPDYIHNAEVDRLRLRIIGPCMQSRGWNSPVSWQAGTHPVAKLAPTQKAPPAAALPWLAH